MDGFISEVGAGPGFSRRGFLKGSIGLGLAVGVGGMIGDFFFDAGWAFADGPTVGLGSGSAPEQVHLTWGSDPTADVTVSWAAPGTAPVPTYTLSWSTSPITAANPGTQVTPTAVSFTDGMNNETVNSYHVPLTGLAAATTYYYTISDGGSPAATFSASFQTAPSGRAAFVFSSYGDLATPTAHLNKSATSWQESCDNSYYAVRAVEGTASVYGVTPPSPPLFHLLNGDLCYANLNTNNQPEVWRDFANNISYSAANRPWMPTLGNHEIEFGNNNRLGNAGPVTDPSNYRNNQWFNGPNGYGQYLSRFLLPDNGVTGLRGNFYSFQVGTVVFIALDADDVCYQDGGSYYAPSGSAPAALTATNPAISIPPGTSTYNNQYTGALTSGPDYSLVPDTSSATPNRQTTWLASTLAAARSNPSVDMIVVFMHQCALSSSGGNGSDLGIRQAWLPLFDLYSVDLVLSGHEHNYERTYAVRGYDATYTGTVVAPNPGQTLNAPVNTRRPTVQSAAQTTIGSDPAFDTSQGTVFLVLGGGGTNGPTNTYPNDAADGLRQAKVITTRNLIVQGTSGYSKDGADSVEDAPWSARTDAADAYGIAYFSVDPGTGPGQTTITMTYYHAPETGSKTNGYVGTTSYTPYETVVFGRGIAGPGTSLPEMPFPELAVAGAALVGGGALYLAQRRNGSSSEAEPAL
jgi:alkaline phosphatase D